MAAEIVLQGDDPGTMNLGDDEQAILDEIEIDSAPMRMRRPVAAKEQVTPEELELPNAFMNPDKKAGPPVQPMENDEPIDYGEVNDVEDMPTMPTGIGMQTGGGMMPQQGPSQGFQSIDDEKADILNKLTRLSSKKGIHVNKRLNMYSDIEELRSELKRVRYSIEVDQSVKFSRRALIACVTGLEFLNKRYDPFDLKLEGWSESMMENVEDYDEVFEELYVKYRTSIKVAPEVRLIMMVGGSGMMFHLTNSMFKSVMPNVNDVMRQNPDLMQNMMSAVQNTMQNPADGRPPPSVDPVSGRKEMKGPGIDLSGLMGGMGMPVPPPPVNTFTGDAKPDAPAIAEDDMSDIISVTTDDPDIKDISVKAPAKRRGGRRKKASKDNEINI
tara:strand:- start:7530 stop:8684 length:1155 start_codon:yes stop_codon:yes gene_type:complete